MISFSDAVAIFNREYETKFGSPPSPAIQEQYSYYSLDNKTWCFNSDENTRVGYYRDGDWKKDAPTGVEFL